MAMLIMTLTTFSQTTLNNPLKIIKDSTTTYYAFNKTQILKVIKDLKELKYDRESIVNLEKQINNFEDLNSKNKELVDTLNKQIGTYVLIITTKNNEINVYQEKIDLMSKNIQDYKKIMDNDKLEKTELKNRISHKNKKIAILVGVEVITIVISLYLLSK